MYHVTAHSIILYNRLEVEYRTMVGLKCVWVEAGEQSAMTSGRTKMQVLHADSLASQNLVRECCI